MNRNSSLDMLKGIGIFLVVLGHATFVNEKIITYIFSFHMPLFFIVSGILMNLTYKEDLTIQTFLTKKLRSIGVPYLCFSICYTIIDFLSVYFKQISLQDLKINAVCTISLAGSGPLWFLPTLFFAELVLFVLVKKFKTNKLIGVTGIACGIVGLIGCFVFRPVFESNKSNLLTMFFMNFVVVILRSMLCQIFLVPGSLLASLLKKFNKKNAFSPIQLIIGIILLAIDFPLSLMNVNIDLHNLNYGNPLLFIICAYLGTIGLYLICNNIPSIKLIEFWGKNSLVIMITHLNFYYLFVGNLLAVRVNQYVTHAKSYIFLFNIMWVAMLLSSLTALLINKFTPWMIGKKKHK